MGIRNKSDPLPNPPGDVDNGANDESDSDSDKDVGDEPIAPYFNLKVTLPTNLKIQKAAAKIVLKREVSYYANMLSGTQLMTKSDQSGDPYTAKNAAHTFHARDSRERHCDTIQ